MNETINEQITLLASLRDKKQMLTAQLKEINAQYKVVELSLLTALIESKLVSTSTAKYTVTHTVTPVPSVKSWDAFYGFIYQHKFIHLLERRVSVLGYRELLSQNIAVPGVIPYDKQTLALRVR